MFKAKKIFLFDKIFIKKIFFLDLFYNYQDGLTSHDSQRPFSSSSSSSSSTDCEFQQHHVPLHIATNQQHVPDHSIIDQITDHHLYDSFGVPCGFNNNNNDHHHHHHSQPNTSPNYHHHHHHNHHHSQHQPDLKPTTPGVPHLGYTSVIVDTQQYHQMANEFVH